MTRLLLVRHCEATGQQPDAPLTDAGRAQALRLAEHLAPEGVDLIASSPFARARQSIAPLAERRGLPIQVDARLAERALSAEPLPAWRDALQRSFEDLDLAWPGGESSRAAMARGRAAIDALLARVERVAVAVTHGNLMALILRSFDERHGLDTWARLSNPDVYVVTVDGARAAVSRAWDRW